VGALGVSDDTILDSFRYERPDTRRAGLVKRRRSPGDRWAGIGTAARLDLVAGRRASRASNTTATRPLVDGEYHLAILILGPAVLVATNAERVMQQTGAHADLQVGCLLTQRPMEPECPLFSTPARAAAG